jgi:anti-sigma regulatory factor (Ser/Thr protein kinase)
MRDSAIITIPSHPKYLTVVRAVTGKMAEISGLADGVIEDIKLAVDEACSNVIKHAYKGNADQKIVIRFRRSQRGFEVIIEDNGHKVHPESIVGRDLQDIRPGGLGVHLIKRTFDIFSFDEKKKKGNRLRLIRYIGRKHGD